MTSSSLSLVSVVIRGRFTVRKLNPGHFSCITVQHKCLYLRKSHSWNVYSKSRNNISRQPQCWSSLRTPLRLCHPGSFYRLRALYTSLSSLISLVRIRDREFFKHDVGAAFACQAHTSTFFLGVSPFLFYSFLARVGGCIFIWKSQRISSLIFQDRFWFVHIPFAS